MRKSRTVALSLAVAAVAGLYAHAANGQATLATYFTSGEISTNSSFSGAQTVSLSPTSPTVFVPLGDYFEFGASTILAGIPNADASDPGQPAYLGLASCQYEVISTDNTASILAPVLGASLGSGYYSATDVLQNVYSNTLTETGDVESGNGMVGVNNQYIYQDTYTSPSSQTPSGVQRLALWGGATASPTAASAFFNQLQYQTVSTGLVGLEPVVTSGGGVNDWYYETSSPANNPTYGQTGIPSNTTFDTSFLAVYIAPSITWTGSSSPAWNTGTANWTNGSSTTYADPDFVTFADGASIPTSVTLSTTVSPDLVTVNSNTNNYTITGTGTISGKANILKEGTSTLTISTKNSFTGGTIADAGDLIVAAQNALSTNEPLTINNSALVQLATNTGLETFSSLTIASTAALDIENNHIILNYPTGSDPIAAIRGYLLTGFNNGHWNGPGIISSTAAANSHYGIGFADGADKVVTGLSSGQIELKYTLLGDANLDGSVNGSDFSILAANFGSGATNWDQGNFLFTSSVNGSDFSALAANFGQGDSGADVQALDQFAIANGLTADVPEPISLGILATGGFILVCRRRRA